MIGSTIHKNSEAESYENLLDKNPSDQNQCFEMLTTPTKSQEKTKIKLKLFPQNLRYKFLDKELNHPVIGNAELEKNETEKLLDVLKRYPGAIGYTIENLKGIIPFVCMHRILLKRITNPQESIGED